VAIRPRILGAAVALSLVACALQQTDVTADAQCGFPDGTALAFAGEGSLRVLGLHRTLDDRGMVYISRDPIVPIDVARDVPVAPARLYCIVFPESEGIRPHVGPLPDGWTLPGEGGAGVGDDGRGPMALARPPAC
jgi:hypothetical protein